MPRLSSNAMTFVFVFCRNVEKNRELCKEYAGRFYGGDDSVADAAQLQRSGRKV